MTPRFATRPTLTTSMRSAPAFEYARIWRLPVDDGLRAIFRSGVIFSETMIRPDPDFELLAGFIQFKYQSTNQIIEQWSRPFRWPPNAKFRDRSFTIVKHQNPRYVRVEGRRNQEWMIRCRESNDYQ
ncbi:hypothetical protein [Burkholderia cepacia]|uniref:hypothetical protein n=1 Tax=Burkholderia TaxID=32008 RepID=UPI0012D9B3B8|nr:hypothetical protein [Burkholderia cepacia]